MANLLRSFIFASATQFPSNSLRNAVTFPAVSGLPTEYGLERPYYHRITPSRVGKGRHWCFLAEIIGVEPWIRVFLRVKDRDGDTCVIAFHDAQRGASFAADCRPGNTIAIIDPDLHYFFDGQTGIRLEDDDLSEGRVKILRFPLATLLEANDLVAKNKGDDKKCENCGKAGVGLSKCTRCGTFYCSKECQTANWTKEHKALCKAVKEVEWFNGKDWESSLTNISFSS